MPKSSEKTVTEIVTDQTLDDIADLPEDDTVVDEAVPVEIQDPHTVLWAEKDAAQYYPSIQQARKDAEIPEHYPAKDLVGRRILILSKRPQKAALPDTGELRDGFFCYGQFTETGERFSTWLGQVALVRDLTALTPPFQTTLVKHGRTYRFE